MPEEDTRVWTLTKAWNVVLLECNGAVIFSQLLEECGSDWRKDVEMIMFGEDDTATKGFRAKPPGKVLGIRCSS